MAPAEPVEDIHMPNGSIMPFIISFGLFVAAVRVFIPLRLFMGLPVIFIGLGITFFTMSLRSVVDDYGYHIHKEDLPNDDKGVKA